MASVTTRIINHILFQIRQPQTIGTYPVYLLLHGWTGDENSMWIFTNRLPEDGIYLSPRGLYDSPSGGYSWHPYQSKIWPSIDDLIPACRTLHDALDTISLPSMDLTKINLIGFSQGAALALTYLLIYPEQVDRVACLSGFLPSNSEPYLQNPSIRHKEIYMAHGSNDEIVLVDTARHMVETLDRAGLRVSYCEDEVGHKLSASCFRGLEAFFTEG